MGEPNSAGDCTPVRSRRRGAMLTAALAALAGAIALGALLVGSASGQTSAVSGSFKACMVADTSIINDHGFDQYSWQGIVNATHDNKSVSGKYLQSATSSDFAPNIQAFMHQGCGLILSVGFDQADATQAAAKQNPNQKFAIVDYTYTPPIKNVVGLHYQTDQSAFLGGYLAAAMSKSHVVGTCGGVNIPTVTIYMSGYVAGVRYYNKQNHAKVKVLGWNPNKKTGLFTGSFTSQTAGELDAKTLMSQGADIIFPVACGPDGAAAAVKAAGAGHYMEWVDVDGCVAVPQYCGLFLTSVEKGLAASVESVVQQAAHGTFKGGVNYEGTLKNGGVAIAPFHQLSSKVPASVKKALANVKAGIIAGKISVNPLSYPAS